MTFLAGISNEAIDWAEARARKIALEIFVGVVEMSPVDTGQFKGNWVVKTPVFTPEVLEILDKRWGETIAAGIASLRLWQYREGHSVWIANNLPYAQRIENGWSTQAPAGVVGVTMARLSAKYGMQFN